VSSEAGADLNRSCGQDRNAAGVTTVENGPRGATGTYPTLTGKSGFGSDLDGQRTGDEMSRLGAKARYPAIRSSEKGARSSLSTSGAHRSSIAFLPQAPRYDATYLPAPQRGFARRRGS